MTMRRTSTDDPGQPTDDGWSRGPISLELLLARIRHDQHGFILIDDLRLLAKHPRYRLTPILVRCGGCRFTAPAQDVEHLTRCVEAGGDYVRDWSLPAGY